MYLIRGDERNTIIAKELMDELIENKGTIECHSHPFIGDLIPSENDKKIFTILYWQKESVIIEPLQRGVKFTINGVSDNFKIEDIREDDYYGNMIWNQGD